MVGKHTLYDFITFKFIESLLCGLIYNLSWKCSMCIWKECVFDHVECKCSTDVLGLLEYWCCSQLLFPCWSSALFYPLQKVRVLKSPIITVELFSFLLWFCQFLLFWGSAIMHTSASLLKIYWYLLLFFKKRKHFFLFGCAGSLLLHPGVFSSCGLLIVVASLVVEHRL